MAVSYVESSTAGATSGTAISTAKPTGTTTGDILVFIINGNGNRTFADNNGATPATSVYGPITYNTTSATYEIWYRVAGGSEPANYAFTMSGSDRWAIIAIALRGGDTSAIWDVSPSASTAASDSANPRGTNTLTTLTDGAMMLACAFFDSNTNTFTAEPADSFTSAQNNSGEQLIAMSYKVQTTAGLQSSVSWTTATDGSECIAHLFSVKAAATGSPWYTLFQ